MVNGFAGFGFGFAYLCLAFGALELFSFLDPQYGAGTTTSSVQAPLLDSAAEVLPPLAAVVVFFVAVTLIYHHLMGRRVGAVPVARDAGNGRRSISGLLMFLLCVSAGTLQFIVFVKVAGAGGGVDHGALALAALRALPAAATATFFLGVMLIIVAHVRAGGEGGGGGGAVSEDGPIQGLLRVLTMVAAGAAAVLVGLMAMAFTLHGAAN